MIPVTEGLLTECHCTIQFWTDSGPVFETMLKSQTENTQLGHKLDHCVVRAIQNLSQLATGRLLAI